MSKYLINFILFTVSLNCFALESSDSMKTQIVKVYDKNILVLNRGSEDGVFKTDHIMLTSPKGFIARGICIKHTMMTSHWKIYRATRPELVSKDTIYKMKSINQSKIPKIYQDFVTVDFSQYMNDIADHNMDKIISLQQKRLIKFDLPKYIKENAVKEKKSQKLDKFLTKNFDAKMLQEDMDQLYLNVHASPVSWQSRGNQVQTDYGMNLYNRGNKYGFALNANLTQAKYTDEVSGTSYKSNSSHYDFNFQVNHIFTNISMISFYSYDTETVGETSYPQGYHQIGLTGIKWHAWTKNINTDFLEVSYIPVFETISYDDPATNSFGERKGLRQRIQLQFNKSLSKKITIENLISVAPFYNISNGGMETSDTNAILKTLWSYKISEYLFWDFELEYTKDQLRGTTYNVSPDNTKNTFRLRYQMPI